jgi:hypothetical protein
MLGCALDLGQVADPTERNLDVRRTRGGRAAILGRALSRTEGASRAASKRVSLAKRVEDLAPDASRGVRAERRATVAAISVSRLHQADETPGDEVLAVGAPAPRIDRSRGDSPCELKMRDDARLDGVRLGCRYHRANLPSG